MQESLYKQIVSCIEFILDEREDGKCSNIIVFPCGYVGMQVISIMRSIYSLEPAYLIDNQKCQYSPLIHDISFLSKINTDSFLLFLCSTNTQIYDDIKDEALKYIPEERIVELDSMLSANRFRYPNYKTEVGKYSCGPICRNHPWIKSIGAFFSFAIGVDVVGNHEFRYLTTHPIIYQGKCIEGYEFSLSVDKNEPWYLSGIEPKTEKITKQRRVTIGNDVWLGRNVIITNGANIGNGVIGAAGAVITKDVPDYAIVAGVPARIIRYRYTTEQIDELNRISWWNWSDDEIRKNYDDFYLPVEDFINKHKRI